MIEEKKVLADAKKTVNDAIDTNVGKDGYVWRSKAWLAVKVQKKFSVLCQDM